MFVNIDTPWKICFDPKNGGLEEYFPFQLGDFRFHFNFVGCLYVCSVLFCYVMFCYIMSCYVVYVSNAMSCHVI